MNYHELLEKYQLLQTENHHLKEEMKRLKQQLGIPEQQGIPFEFQEQESLSRVVVRDYPNTMGSSEINNFSDPLEKIRLFMSLFRGRGDVYAKRWENKKKGTSGYSPVCLNEWQPGLCVKPKGRCADCAHKAYDALDERVIDAHLRGTNNFVVGIYPLLIDETCCFLAVDFDDEEWQKDISVLREICLELDIPVAVERSRSGQGAHACFSSRIRYPHF